jgi:hypothetical protein
MTSRPLSSSSFINAQQGREVGDKNKMAVGGMASGGKRRTFKMVSSKETMNGDPSDAANEDLVKRRPGTTPIQSSQVISGGAKKAYSGTGSDFGRSGREQQIRHRSRAFSERAASSMGAIRE